MMPLFMMLSWDVHCAQFPLLVKTKLLLTGEEYMMSATSKRIQLLFVPSPLKIPVFVIPVVLWKMTAMPFGKCWSSSITVLRLTTSQTSKLPSTMVPSFVKRRAIQLTNGRRKYEAPVPFSRLMAMRSPNQKRQQYFDEALFEKTCNRISFFQPALRLSSNWLPLRGPISSLQRLFLPPLPHLKEFSMLTVRRNFAHTVLRNLGEN
jgi:hypothetical protein